MAEKMEEKIEDKGISKAEYLRRIKEILEASHDR